MNSEAARFHLAWLMWCWSEDYIDAEDRENMHNWLLDDPATLNTDDRRLRTHLLVMADEILTKLWGEQK